MPSAALIASSPRSRLLPPRRRRRLPRLALLVLVVLVLGLLGLGAQQRLPVGDRDLVVVGMDFAEGEEAVTVPAIFDEGSLERRFYAGDPREIDVSFELLLVL